MTALRLIFITLIATSFPALGLQNAADTGEEVSNKVRWRTSSEESNFGFNVYRSESKEGPFEKLNDDPIEGGGTTDTPRDYLYEDKEIDPKKGYFYYIESISLEGERERFTPIIYAKAKNP
jgi:hypothetical protein